MRCIVIDAVKREIREEQMTEPTLAFMQKAVDGYICLALHLDDANVLFVDDEGFLKPPSVGFMVQGARQDYAGSGIICGVNRLGETIGATIPLDQVKALVRFITWAPTAAAQ